MASVLWSIFANNTLILFYNHWQQIIKKSSWTVAYKTEWLYPKVWHFFKGKGWNIEICQYYVSIPFFNDANEDNIITVSPMTNRPEKEIRIKGNFFWGTSCTFFVPTKNAIRIWVFFCFQTSHREWSTAKIMYEIL